MQVVEVEDGGFSRQLGIRPSQRTLLVCTLFDGLHLKDCLFEKIAVDGLDATDKLASLLHGAVFDVVMLAEGSFAGFNLVDPNALFDEFSKPVIVVSRDKPNNIAVKNALVKQFKDWKRRWWIFEKLGTIYEVFSKPSEQLSMWKL